MKSKIKGILVLACICMLATAVCPVSAETAVYDSGDEAAKFSTAERAEYMMEKLQLSLENQAEAARDLLYEADVSDEVLSELEGYIAELDALADSVAETDLTESPEDLAQTFQSVREEAISITKNFRETLVPELSDEEKAELKEKVAERKEIRKTEAKARLEESISKLETRMAETETRIEEQKLKIEEKKADYEESLNKTKPASGHVYNSSKKESAEKRISGAEKKLEEQMQKLEKREEKLDSLSTESSE